MSQIHIMHLIDGMNVGGAEVSLLRTMAGLIRRGFQVSVVYSTPGPLAQEFEKLDLNLVRLPHSSLVDPGLLVKMVRTMRALRPHVVHTHLFKSDFHGRIAARLAQVPVVVSTLHNADIWARKRPLGWIYGATGLFTDKIIACSNEVGQYHIEHTGISPKNLITIENAVDLSPFMGYHDGSQVRKEFGISPEAPLFVIIGRLKPQKDHVNFLTAAAEILQAVPTARFLVIGDGPLRAELEAQAQQLGLFPALIFTGLRSDIPAIMAALDVLVLSSQWEGLPITLLEGMASSRPVVATAVNGIQGVAVPDVTALLVAPQAPEALAKACIRLASDPDLRERMGKAGFERVQRYSLEILLDQTIDLYGRLLQKRGLGQLVSAQSGGSG